MKLLFPCQRGSSWFEINLGIHTSEESCCRLCWTWEEKQARKQRLVFASPTTSRPRRKIHFKREGLRYFLTALIHSYIKGWFWNKLQVQMKQPRNKLDFFILLYFSIFHDIKWFLQQIKDFDFSTMAHKSQFFTKTLDYSKVLFALLWHTGILILIVYSTILWHRWHHWSCCLLWSSKKATVQLACYQHYY